MPLRRWSGTALGAVVGSRFAGSRGATLSVQADTIRFLEVWYF
jgi:hypothetical protein